MVVDVNREPLTKAALRAAILARRRAIPAETRRADAEALARHLLAAVPAGATVCAYVPVGSEPGSLAALDALTAAGVRVLLPVAREESGQPRPLSWGVYRAGALVEAPFGLREPAAPWLPAEAIASASISATGNLSSVSLVSCRHNTSTGFSASQLSTWPRRTLRELTFQVAIFILIPAY